MHHIKENIWIQHHLCINNYEIYYGICGKANALPIIYYLFYLGGEKSNKDDGEEDLLLRYFSFSFT